MEFQCFEVKPKEECPLDDKPSTGMFAGSDEHLLFLHTDLDIPLRPLWYSCLTASITLLTMVKQLSFFPLI